MASCQLHRSAGIVDTSYQVKVLCLNKKTVIKVISAFQIWSPWLDSISILVPLVEESWEWEGTEPSTFPTDSGLQWRVDFSSRDIPMTYRLVLVLLPFVQPLDKTMRGMNMFKVCDIKRILIQVRQLSTLHWLSYWQMFTERSPDSEFELTWSCQTSLTQTANLWLRNIHNKAHLAWHGLKLTTLKYR